MTRLEVVTTDDRDALAADLGEWADALREIVARDEGDPEAPFYVENRDRLWLLEDVLGALGGGGPWSIEVDDSAGFRELLEERRDQLDASMELRHEERKPAEAAADRDLKGDWEDARLDTRGALARLVNQLGTE